MVCGTSAWNGARLTALVVDDDPVIRRIHEVLLSKFGFETQVAENGKEAVDLIHSGERFELIFMDMEMPVMDGSEATRAMRAMGVTSTIVGITSRNLNSEQKHFIEAGLDYCHVKPMNNDKIISLIESLNN